MGPGERVGGGRRMSLSSGGPDLVATLSAGTILCAFSGRARVRRSWRGPAPCEAAAAPPRQGSEPRGVDSGVGVPASLRLTVRAGSVVS